MTDLARDRSRLIDHFKRLHSIVVGLAITDGVRKLLPFDSTTFSYSSLWMFFTFFVTVVPIFQGADRSLDITYLDERKDGKPHNRIHYIWDVYMLLFTAIAFVAIAESIPSVDPAHKPISPLFFFYTMMGMLILDVIILIIDRLKTNIDEKKGAYTPWIVLNASFAVAFGIAIALMHNCPNISVATIAACILICALARTGGDYYFGRSFMFPRSQHPY